MVKIHININTAKCNNKCMICHQISNYRYKIITFITTDTTHIHYTGITKVNLCYPELPVKILRILVWWRMPAFLCWQQLEMQNFD